MAGPYRKRPGLKPQCFESGLSAGGRGARGMGTWQAPYAPAGAVQNKVTDAAGAEKMSMTAALGHACGIGYKAQEHLARHPEFAWMKDILHDMPARGWTRFTAK